MHESFWDTLNVEIEACSVFGQFVPSGNICRGAILLCIGWCGKATDVFSPEIYGVYSNICFWHTKMAPQTELTAHQSRAPALHTAPPGTILKSKTCFASNSTP